MSSMATEFKDVLSRGWKFGLGIAVLWVASIAAYQTFMDARDTNDPACFEDAFENSDTSLTPIAVTAPSGEQLRLGFKQSRGTEMDQMIISAVSKPPEKLEVAASALERDGHTIRSEDVHVRAKSQRDNILLDICVDARKIGRVQSGTYKGVVTFTDERVAALAVPVEVTIQARYLWWLAPLVLILPVVALYVAWGSLPRKDRPILGVGLIRTVILSIGAVAVVYGAQGLANDGWGGPQKAFGLIGSMYAAAAAAAVTVGTPSNKE